MAQPRATYSTAVIKTILEVKTGTKVSTEVATVFGELLRALAVEAAQRSKEHASIDGREADLQEADLEAILPQLLLDFH